VSDYRFTENFGRRSLTTSS